MSSTPFPVHSYRCALPTRGGVCDCQAGHHPSPNARVEASGLFHHEIAALRLATSPSRPGGQDRMFTRLRPSELLEGEQPAA